MTRVDEDATDYFAFLVRTDGGWAAAARSGPGCVCSSCCCAWLPGITLCTSVVAGLAKQPGKEAAPAAPHAG